jgi:hypothetical protein
MWHIEIILDKQAEQDSLWHTAIMVNGTHIAWVSLTQKSSTNFLGGKMPIKIEVALNG